MKGLLINFQLLSSKAVSEQIRDKETMKDKKDRGSRFHFIRSLTTNLDFKAESTSILKQHLIKCVRELPHLWHVQPHAYFCKRVPPPVPGCDRSLAGSLRLFVLQKHKLSASRCFNCRARAIAPPVEDPTDTLHTSKDTGFCATAR